MNTLMQAMISFTAQAKKNDDSKVIKTSELGYFYLNAPIAWGEDDMFVYNGKTIYHDVFSFCNRIYNLEKLRK
jgi:hypothetical protein